MSQMCDLLYSHSELDTHLSEVMCVATLLLSMLYKHTRIVMKYLDVAFTPAGSVKMMILFKQKTEN